LRYTEDGRLSIDNNAAERAMKLLALGRKNWLFVASKTGGNRAAILFSLVASCKANQVEPFAYLQSLFQELPARRGDSAANLDDLLPGPHFPVTAGSKSTPSTAGKSTNYAEPNENAQENNARPTADHTYSPKKPGCGSPNAHLPDAKV